MYLLLLSVSPHPMKQILPSLNYPYNALEPYIDAKTMEIHHTKHHQVYIDKLNAVIEKHNDLADKTTEELLQTLSTLSLDEPDKKMIRNHGGGHSNHSLFWTIMGPDKVRDESLIEEIQHTFGSLDEFKKMFTNAATMHFGSGWAWLARNSNQALEIYTLPNQDSPYLQGHTPIIGLDVWEHAYYLKYQNRRAEYIEQWWNALKLI